MRILHTSDWHIGRKLYEYSMIEEQEKFLNWLLECVIQENIELLIVAGDIFDSAVPSGVATDLYYTFLFKFFSSTDASMVIVAGNHDSASRLGAPRDFLKMARIHVISGYATRPQDYLVEFGDGEDMVYLAAIPYLPEGELLPHVSFESQIETSKRYRRAISHCYNQTLALADPSLPKILVGHFFLQGGQVGESERVISIGGTEPVGVEDLPDGLTYGALGHLHRAQEISGRSYPIMYSGSPMPMTFKEAEYGKYVYLVDTDKSSVEPIPVPSFRELRRVNGNFLEIIHKADGGDWSGVLIEAALIVDEPIPGSADRIREAFEDRGGTVLSIQPKFLTGQTDMEVAAAEELMLRTPEDIFREFYMSNFNGSPPDGDLMDTFIELVQMVQGRVENEDTEA